MRRIPDSPIDNHSQEASHKALMRMTRMYESPERFGETEMIVCCCNAFNDRAVDAAISDGARSVAQVYKTIGVTPRCGACKDVIRGLINSRLEAAPAAAQMPSMIGLMEAATAA